MIAFLLIAASAAAPAPAVVAQVENAIDRGRLVQAAEMIALATKQRPARKSPAMMRAIGRLALVEERPGDAFLFYKQAYEADPADCVAAEGMGLSALRLGRLNAARAAIEDAIGKCPDRWQSWNALAVLADRAGDWMASRHAYLAALELDPENPRILNNAGYSMILQRRYADAETILRRALANAPADKRIANNLDLAVTASGKPVDRSDDDAERLNNAGYMAYLTGQPETARTYLSQAANRGAMPSPKAAANLELIEGTPNE